MQPTPWFMYTARSAVGVWVILVLVFSFAAVNIALVLTSPLAIMSSSRYRDVCAFLCGRGWTFLVFTLESPAMGFGIKLRVFGDTIRPEDRNVIVLSNHRLWMDWCVLFALAFRAHRLHTIKMLVKKMVGDLPLVGSAIRMIGWVPLDRTWARDSKKLTRAYAWLSDQAALGHPFWLQLHPEGTRFSKAALARSRAFAREKRSELLPDEPTRVPLLDYTLLPRAKGFSSTVHHLGPHAQAIYDVTLFYDPARTGEGFFTQWFRGGTTEVVVDIRRHDMTSLPTDDAKAMGQWLFDRWAEKDRLIADFHRGFTEQRRWPSSVADGLDRQRVAAMLSQWFVVAIMSWWAFFQVLRFLGLW